MPGWKIREASNGETALNLVETTEVFDVIFMDQYMSSAEKQLLGTETVRAMRAKGVTQPIICGLSANDLEKSFLNEGADAFMIKPFPCKPDELKIALTKILQTRPQQPQPQQQEQQKQQEQQHPPLSPTRSCRTSFAGEIITSPTHTVAS